MNLKYFSDPHDAENFEPFPIMFSRGSVAYEGNLAPLASNQPGFIDGEKGVYGLGVFEQYSNPLTANQSKPTNITDFSAWQGDISYDTSDESVKFIPTNILDSKLNMSNRVVLPSSKYTMSVYIKTNKTAGTIRITGGITKSDFTYLGGVESINYSAADFINGGWIHFTFDTTADTGRYYPTIWWLNPGANAQLKYYRGQLLNKPYPLPWILGGTTRQPESCHIPVEEVKKFLKLNEGCIEGLIRVNSALKHASNKTILHLENGTNLLELSRTSANEWIFKTDNASNPTNINLSDTTTLDNRVPFTIQYGGGKGRIIINGVSSNLTDLNLPTLFNNLIIGAKTGGSQHISTFLRSLCFNKTRGVDDLINRQKFAKENGYYPIDDKVTAFMDLTTDLKAYRRSTL